MTPILEREKKIKRATKISQIPLKFLNEPLSNLPNRKALARASLFSWEAVVETTDKSYQSTIRNRCN